MVRTPDRILNYFEFTTKSLDKTLAILQVHYPTVSAAVALRITDADRRFSISGPRTRLRYIGLVRSLEKELASLFAILGDSELRRGYSLDEQLEEMSDWRQL